MYAGQIVETGPASEIFKAPRHPYTQALMRSLPESASGSERLQALPGVVPGANDRPSGCLLNPALPLRHRALPQRGTGLRRPRRPPGQVLLPTG